MNPRPLTFRTSSYMLILSFIFINEVSDKQDTSSTISIDTSSFVGETYEDALTFFSLFIFVKVNMKSDATFLIRQQVHNHSWQLIFCPHQITGDETLACSFIPQLLASNPLRPRMHIKYIYLIKKSQLYPKYKTYRIKFLTDKK